MREKIVEIITNSGRGLNPIEIMDLVKKNSTAEDLRSLIHELDLLCRDGVLRCTSGNNYIINDLLTGVVDEHEKGNAHILIDGEEDIFISKNNMKGAHNKDLVLVDLIDKTKREGKIVRILKRSLGSNVAEVVNDNGVLKVVPVTSNLPYEVVIEDTDLNLVDGLYVHLEYIDDLGHNRVLARIDKILGHKNALLNKAGEPTEISGEIAKIACEYEIPLMFREETLEEAKKMPKSLSKELIDEELSKGRVDFRNEIIYTIDGKDTKDIDDAISVKILPNGNYELGVHIADVSYYVKPGMSLWKEAEERGNSNYLGNKVIPMLPVELSNGICSLNPNEDRFTESCIMEIDHSGKVVNKKVCKGIIKSKKKMNYDAVQALIDKDFDSKELEGYDTLVYNLKDGETLADVAFKNGISTSELLEYNKDFNTSSKEVNVPCYKVIENAYKLSKEISAMKKRRGELAFLSDEAKIYQDDNDVPYDVKARDSRPAERLIEDFMVAANESVAEFLTEHKLATYRIHGMPLQKKMEEYLKFLELIGIHYPVKFNIEDISPLDVQHLLDYIKDEKMYKMLNKKLLRSMQKAVYSTENIGHFGIASPMYTHFTSPIRRMDDLLNHTSISYILGDKAIDSKLISSWNSYLATICEHISECERNSEKCEYAVDDMLKAYYMQDHIGDEFEATVDTLLSGSFFVQTDNYIDGRCDIIEKGENNYIGVNSYYDYNENIMAYTRNNRVDLRYGDRVLVRCTASNPEAREIDFALIRKI